MEQTELDRYQLPVLQMRRDWSVVPQICRGASRCIGDHAAAEFPLVLNSPFSPTSST